MKRPPPPVADARLRALHPRSGFHERAEWVRQYLASNQVWDTWVVGHMLEVHAQRRYVLAVRLALGRVQINSAGLIRQQCGGRWVTWGSLNTPQCDALVAGVFNAYSQPR